MALATTIRMKFEPVCVVTFTLISNLVTDYIQKRRGEPGLFSFEYNMLPKNDIKVKVTTWIGHLSLLKSKASYLQILSL